MVRCATCGLVRMDPIPTLEELATFYAKDYYAYRPLAKSSFIRTLAKRTFKTQINTHNPAFETPGEFLDVGCGSGEYLRLMKGRGWHVRGVEPSSFGAAQAKKDGLDVFNGTLNDARFPSNSFDYIRSNHSFEHVPNPREVLRDVYRILRPGGKLFIGVPNTASVAYRLFGKYWWYLGIPVHTYGYSTANLCQFLRSEGFEIEKVYYQSNYSSFLGSLQIFLSRKTTKKSTEGWLIRNPLLKLLSNGIARICDLMRRGDAIEVIATRPR